MKNNHYIPLVCTLLNDKNQKSYINIFQIIYNYFLTFNIQFEIRKVYVDFEVAIHNAIHEIWPLSEIRGCRFHLGQSWYRTIQKLGLSTEYEQKIEIGEYLTYIFGLPFSRSAISRQLLFIRTS